MTIAEMIWYDLGHHQFLLRTEIGVETGST